MRGVQSSTQKTRGEECLSRAPLPRAARGRTGRRPWRRKRVVPASPLREKLVVSSRLTVFTFETVELVVIFWRVSPPIPTTEVCGVHIRSTRVCVAIMTPHAAGSERTRGAQHKKTTNRMRQGCLCKTRAHGNEARVIPRLLFNTRVSLSRILRVIMGKS
jgi:hypothetical protein